MPKSAKPDSDRSPRGCGYARGRVAQVLKMSARARANALNALQSTGPRTAAGKAVSSRNARRHGLRASSVIPDEKIKALAAELGEGPVAWMAAELTLRLLRIRLEKTALFNKTGPDVSSELPALMTLADYDRKTWSLRQKAFRALDANDEPIWPNEANLAPGLMR
jgi:hypothetical protein